MSEQEEPVYLSPSIKEMFAAPTPYSQLLREMPSFQEIAGQNEAVIEAMRLTRALNNPDILQKRGALKPKGVLLEGPPGTGKTLLAKAIAKEANASFREVSADTINSKWYGESEQNMKDVFNEANKDAKIGRNAIIFFDELDSLSPNRDEAHEVSQRVISVLLQNMDGMHSDNRVTVIGTTNRKDAMDKALLRPGRFDKSIKMDLPDNDGRIQILRLHMNKAKSRATEPNTLFRYNLDLNKIAKLTSGLSPAELENIVNMAIYDNTMKELEEGKWQKISESHLLRHAVKHIKDNAAKLTIENAINYIKLFESLEELSERLGVKYSRKN